MRKWLDCSFPRNTSDAKKAAIFEDGGFNFRAVRLQRPPRRSPELREEDTDEGRGEDLPPEE